MPISLRCVDFGLSLGCSLLKEALYLDDGQERAHSSFQFQIASTCKVSICRLNIRPFCSGDAHSLWAECRLGAWEPWMQFLLLCPDLSSRVCSDFLSGTGDRFEQRPNSEAEKCTFSPFLPAAHDHALHNTSLPNSFCLKVFLSKLL